jgi:uncharacterized membrane protein
MATETSPFAGAALGAAGAVVGAYSSFALRRDMISAMGDLRAGLFEDIIAITAAIAIVYSL